MRNLLFFFLVALAPAIGCTESMIIIGGDGGGADAGPGADSATQTDSGPGIACGANTCRQGTVCCNESCGECVAPGGACLDIECTAPVVCDGNVCADTAMCCGGCPGEPSSCSGPDGECPPVSCAGPICGGEACSFGSLTCCAGCGGEEICSGPGGECPAIDCPPPSPCDAQDVRFEGGCEPGLRYWWNGSACIGDAGCDCVGADCDETFSDEASCNSAFVGCEPPPTCVSDRECSEGEYCDGCARSSCEFCDDCISGCRAHACVGEDPVVCAAIAPECGEDGVAVASGGCWECVNVRTCELIGEPEI